MKKKIVAIVAVVAVITLIFVAYGCGKSNIEPETAVITSASAAETSQLSFNFEEVYYDYNNKLTIFRETTTDSLFVKYSNLSYKAGAGGLTQMMDPETGLPLTYTVWQEKYAS